MTTLSTTQLIEAMRTVAVAAETEQGREKLNAIANRMEMLVAANAGMDLQLNSIRSALNIPTDQSVQAGVIDAFSRKSSDIEELTEKSNRLRRTAKEHQEENQQLRTELAELRGQTPVAWRYFQETPTDGGYWVLHNDKPLCSGVSPLYAEPTPPAASQHVPDEWSLNKAWKIDGLDKMTPHQAHRAGYEQCLATMLQPSGNSPQWIGVDWAKGCDPVSSALVAENLALKEIIDRVTDLDNEPQYHESGMGCGLEDRNITDRYEAMRHGWDAAMERVYGEVIPCAEELSFPTTEQAARELMAKGVDQAASGFHEKAFVAFDGSNEHGLYIRAQLQLLAQQLRDGDA